MFFKAIITSEGLAKSLIDEVDPIAAAEPYIRQFLKDNDINCDLAGLRQSPDDTPAAEFISSLPFVPTTR